MEAPDLPIITGDGDRLAQVFTNLVDNALKFNPSGGNIRLRAAQSGSEVQVEVADTGARISSETLPYILTRFYQDDPSKTGGKKNCAGLGLAIVKEILEAHGGKIDVLSEPGKGRTFIVNLPLKTP